MNTRFPQSLVIAILSLLLIASSSLDSNAQEKQRGSTSQATQRSHQVADKQAQERELKNHSPLITADQLKSLIDAGDKSLRILEPATSTEGYSAGHVPNAQFVHWVTDMTNPENRELYNNLTADQFAKLMKKLGIGNESRIVIYDRLSNRLSTRLYWTMKYYGHDKVQVLDGGHFAWGSKFKQSKEIVKFEQVDYKLGKPNTEILAEMKFVKEQLNNPDARFVDGRPPEQFKGKVPGRVFHTNQPHPRLGHIPKATNIFWNDNFKKDGSFKSKDELRTLYQNAGIKPDQCVVTYCNEGLHAAPPWFVLTQLLGYKNVKLYDSSMGEWTKTKNPMAVIVEESDSPKQDQPSGSAKKEAKK